jgi:hypothetical protein
MNVETFRLSSPTMGVERGGSNGQMKFVTIPAGGLLKVVGDPQQSGLVDVCFEGRIVAMFLQDLEDRGERIFTRAV